jgi:hypothetical protein
VRLAEIGRVRAGWRVARGERVVQETLLVGRHPITGDVYELRRDGLLRVFTCEGEAGGLFKRNGEWVCGDVRAVDQHFCQWLSQKGFAAAPTRANPLVGR